MRTDIKFLTSDGLQLAGWLYSPPVRFARPFPAIAMAHGFTAVKEQFLDRYAEVFAAAGFGVLVYDNRNFGDSEGAPRGEVDPLLQVRDYRDAITFLQSLDGVDANRIGVWGASHSGGHILQVSAFDRRVRCVVAQVPYIRSSFDMRLARRADLLPPLFEAFDDDRRRRYDGELPAYLEVVSQDSKSDCALPGQDSYDFFVASQREFAPNWRNQVTLKSVEMLHEYEPAATIHRISPTPLLMIVAERDTLTDTCLALDAFERALHPKELLLLDGGHFDPYVRHFRESATAALDYFCRHLQPW